MDEISRQYLEKTKSRTIRVREEGRAGSIFRHEKCLLSESVTDHDILQFHKGITAS